LASPDRLSKGMVTANAHTLNNVWGSRSFRMAIDAIPVRLNDGIGFRIAARMRGVDPCYNFNGTDLIPRLLSELEDPLRVFLYGASEEANLKVATWLEEKYPLVRVVGRINGYVDPEKEAVPAIVKTDADLVLVALGHPKQEIFVARHASELNAKIVYCVGGLFDFLSGTKPRAPKIFRVASLEWVFRLAIEPRRMFRRYVVGNPVFLLRSLRQTVSDRRVKLNEARKVAV
jgi:exopolysaccharide biosynthesis WecB/TagA/CpsF family protein